MAEKTIGIVCTSKGFGGLEMNTLKLAKWLEEYGWTVRLLLNGESITYARAKDFVADITSIQQLGGGNKHASVSIISKWLKTAHVKILFTPYNKDIAALSTYKRFKNRNIRLVYQQHMKIGVKKRDLIHTLRYGMIDKWISPLHYLKQETLEKTRVKNDKIEVIPFGLELAPFMADNITKMQARQILDLPQNAFLIGVLGRIDPKKGQDFLIIALKKLLKQDNNIHLLIMGDLTPNEGGQQLKLLYNLVEQHNLASHVHFRKYQKEVMLFYKAIDIFAMPSHGETFGMVTIEAMAAGVPVVGVSRDGTKEILQNGRLGHLHELNDVKEYCDAISAIKTHGASQQIAAARKEATEKYNVNDMMHHTNTLLQQLIK